VGVFMLMMSLGQPCLGNGQEEVAGPADPGNAAVVATWLSQLKQWRASTRKMNNYTGDIYNVSALTWTQTTYIQPQVGILASTAARKSILCALSRSTRLTGPHAIDCDCIFAACQ